MSAPISGNTRGLSPSDHKRLERLFHRKVEDGQLVPLEFARELVGVANDLRRKLAVIVSREGRIEELAVGSKEIVYLPDLGRYRLGKGRLRRLRLIFSDLSETGDFPHIPTDIYTDLEKLRLDMVVSLRPQKNRMAAAYAYMVPRESGGTTTKTEQVKDIATFDFDINGFMEAVEEQLTEVAESGVVHGPNPALLVGVYEKSKQGYRESFAELEELARTAGVTIAERIVQRRTLDPRTLLGKGKLEEVVLTALRHGAEIIIFDSELRPTQWRSITNATDLKVLDRSMLILDIFAQRAKSSDGRLQVELAQLKYNLPRLVETDSGLSRLSGGIGGRGPGETKLEISRRRARDKIAELERRISKLSEQRGLRRSRRSKNEVPLVAILGYTNVGKSTLFNALTKSDVLVENKLFATLDTTQRRMTLPDPGSDTGTPMRELVMSDTVGFIRDLPDELKNSFRATLEEVYDAELLLHVIDAQDPTVEEKLEAVRTIIAEMGMGDVPELVVINKIDGADPAIVEGLIRSTGGKPVSAIKRQGFAELVKDMVQRIVSGRATLKAAERSKEQDLHEF